VQWLGLFRTTLEEEVGCLLRADAGWLVLQLGTIVGSLQTALQGGGGADPAGSDGSLVSVETSNAPPN
jgi:hypothetical protein